MHVAAGDRSRCACAGALPDERGPATAVFPGRAIARFDVGDREAVAALFARVWDGGGLDLLVNSAARGPARRSRSGRGACARRWT